MIFLKLIIHERLKSKGVDVPAHHIDELELRWETIERLKGDQANALLDDYDIALRHLPGGDYDA